MVIIRGKRSVRTLFAGLALCMSAPAFSAIQMWNWDPSSDSFSSSNWGNTLSMSEGGVGLTVSGWSDTEDLGGDDEVQNAKLIWANSSSLGVQNRDEGTSSPDHSIDSVTSDPDGEFDMVLLEFDTAVALEGIDLSWARGAGNNKTDISILAYDGTGSSSLAGNTWADIFSGNGGNYDSVGNYSGVGLSYYAVNPGDVMSTKWLIGVYNPVFGSGGDYGDDGFKLDLVKTSTSEDPPSETPVPGSLPMILLGLVLLRKKFSARSAAV